MHHFGEMSANDCFQFWLLGPYAIVDFLVLEVFNTNNLLSEAVVGLKLFYLKALENSFARSSKRPNLFKFKTWFAATKIMPYDKVKHAWCLFVCFNLDGL